MFHRGTNYFRRLLWLVLAAGTAAGCGGSSLPSPSQLASPGIRRVMVTFARAVRVGEPVEVGATLSDAFLARCPDGCGAVGVRLVTTRGEVLGELPLGGRTTVSFARPGLYVVSPRLITQPPGRLAEESVEDLLVVPVAERAGDVLVPADARVLTVLREGKLVRIFVNLTNAHLRSPGGQVWGYLDPAYKQVHLFLVALNEQGEEIYRSDEAVVEVEGERLVEIRHTLRSPEATRSLRVVVGVKRLVPSMRELFITPQSFELSLPTG